MNKDKLVLMVDGQEKTYDVYFSFTCPETNKGYITYSDHEKDSEGREIVLVGAYDPNKSTKKILEVTDPNELAMVQEVLAKIQSLA